MIDKGKPSQPAILVVDDEAQIQESLADLFRREFHVFATEDADEALGLLRKHSIALLLADQRMPRVTGTELLIRAARISPDTIRVLLTAYSDIQAIAQSINEGRLNYYLTKPWDPEGLLELARRTTKQYALANENRHLLQQLEEWTQRFQAAQTTQQKTSYEPPSLESENRTLRSSVQQLESTFQTLQKIQEVIPICMECGKIKTGESRWQDIVQYLKENTRFLSHGYCPQCQQKLIKEWGLDKEFTG